jgi:hypothetical protein
VARQQHGGAVLDVQSLQVPPQLVAELQVYPGSQLVENDEPRAVHERSCDQQPAAHPAGQPVRLRAGLRSQIECVE